MNKIPIVLILFFFVVSVSAQLQGCNQLDDRMIRMGMDVKNDVVVFFRKNVTENEEFEFTRTVIGIPEENGSGYSSLPGIISTIAVRRGDFSGVAIQFRESATEEQKQNVVNRIRRSPIVHKIYFNAIPDEIEDL